MECDFGSATCKESGAGGKEVGHSQSTKRTTRNQGSRGAATLFQQSLLCTLVPRLVTQALQRRGRKEPWRRISSPLCPNSSVGTQKQFEYGGAKARPGRMQEKNSCEKRLCEIELLYQFKHSFGDVEEEQESLLLLLLLFGAVHNPLGGTAGNFPRVCPCRVLSDISSLALAWGGAIHKKVLHINFNFYDSSWNVTRDECRKKCRISSLRTWGRRLLLLMM